MPTLRTKDGRTLPGVSLAAASRSSCIAASMDLRPLLARIDAPTLVIAGERDPFGGPMTQEIAQALPNATQVTVPEADHFPFLEPGRRAAWSRAVLEFLAG